MTEIIYTRVPNLRFAYTYKDTHPTFCTLISDDVLPYRYQEDEYDETDPLLAQLERDIAEVREKNKLARSRLPSHESNFPLILENSFDGHTLWEVHKLRDYLEGIETSRVLMKSITRVIAGPVASAECYGDTLIVNPHSDMVRVALASIKAIRVAHNPVVPYKIEDLILYNRLIEADSLYWVWRFSWEKLLLGDSLPMKLFNSVYPSLAVAGAREAMSNFRSLRDGNCARAFTEAWFLEEYCRATDSLTIRLVLAEPSRSNSSVSLSPQEACRVGSVEGTSYLSSVITTIMADPIFTEVRNRRDANFVWFLRFESSFRESENNA